MARLDAVRKALEIDADGDIVTADGEKIGRAHV